ncbi:MAG: undecaprenyl-diphosphate phosphatase [Bacteroidales bacterium]|jgi:undecaprenyl-diphosphatase|nr:undecaprenyl-diphosphate phosphatase [Bacteroidales bacterium]
MNWLEALILGLLQGLTEFLPVSSSGHLAIAQYLFEVDAEQNLVFAILVHFATVLATICVFYKEIGRLFKGLFQFKWNFETKYVVLLLISAIPVAVVAVFFKNEVESLFTSGLWIIACALLLTALLLTLSHFITKYYEKSDKKSKTINFLNAFIIGISQAIAIIPGLSRSGTTISTGLMLGMKREEVAKFSFLMVIIPIVGEAMLDILGGGFVSSGINILPMIVGFVAAFVSGLLACKFMLAIVKKAKLWWFSIYCIIAATVAFIFS